MFSRWLTVCLSICPPISPSVLRLSIFLFLNYNLCECQWIFTKLSMFKIMWRSDLGLLMGKFRQFLTELPACNTSDFTFPDDNE